MSLADDLKSVNEFSLFGEDERSAVARMAKLYHAGPSEVLCKEEERPSALYFILSGSVNLIANPENEIPVAVDTLYEGAFFGRGFSDPDFRMPHRVQATADPVVLQVIGFDDLTTFLDANPESRKRLETAQKISSVIDFLSNAHSLRGVPRDGLISLALDAELQTVPAGSSLISQGEKEDNVYLIVKGNLAVTRNEAPSHIIATINQGGIVGEMAVITGEVRTANVGSETESIVYRISGDSFREVVSNHEELAKGMQILLEERREAKKEPVKTKEEEKTEKVSVKDRDKERQERLAKVMEKDYPLLPKKTSLFGHLRKPPAILQHSEMDCSAACLSTICLFYGKRVSINTTRELARVRQDGASMANVIRAAKELGFNAEGFISTIEQLREKTIPAIANWRGYHWVVVHEVTADKVIVADPAEGLVTFTIAEFEEGWSRYTIFLQPTQKFSELEETGPTLQAFAEFFRPYKRTILEIFLASAVIQIISVMLPLFTKFVVDDVILKGDEQWLMAGILVMGGVTLLSIALSFLRDDMALRLSMSCNMAIIGAVYDRLMALPISFFEVRKTGDITTRLEQHETITDFITEDGLETLLSLMSVIIYFSFMIYFNAYLTFAAVFFLMFNILIIQKISPKIRQIARETFVKEAEQESHLIESLRGAATLKTIGADHMARWDYENHFAAVSNMQFKEAKYSQMAGLISGTLDHLGDIAVLFLGAVFVIQGEMTIGALIAFTVFANGLQDPVGSLIGKWDELQEVFVSIERLNDILEKEPEFELEEEDSQQVSLPRLRGDITFENVTFRYEPDDQDNVVQGINFSILQGTKVALVGGSGSGKSTIIKLLLGFYPLNSGRILVDGFDISELPLSFLRSQFAMVPQQSLIFRGSVRDNIALARPKASPLEIEDAARLAGAHEFISAIPGGYDAMLEEQGGNLSGGQHQRIILSRAFLQESPILVMDEATSALDTETERFVMKNIDARYTNKTILIIAHRLSTIQNADTIIVLNQGLVVETGTHKELIKYKGYYYRLCANQLGVE